MLYIFTDMDKEAVKKLLQKITYEEKTFGTYDMYDF